MPTICFDVSERTYDVVQQFTETQGMTVESYLISVLHAHAKAHRNPLHTRILWLLAQGLTDGEVATEVGMDQTVMSVSRVRRMYHLPPNRRYRKADA